MRPPHFESLPKRKLRVALLMGGPSAEREISLQSGAAVSRALESLGHVVRQVDPLHVNLNEFPWDQFDVAFIALHGTFGEDGEVQQILERALIPYTGSGVAASRLAISKSASKERFIQSQIATAPYVLIHDTDARARIEQLADQLGYPLVVKPDAQGSSLGVTIVQQKAQLAEALDRCFQLDHFGLMERAIRGAEWTVGLLDERVFPPIRIATKRAFFDYAAKYQDDETQHLFDSDVSAGQLDRIIQTARGACTAVGTCGLVRVDLIVDENGCPIVLEVNTVPGLTDHSLVPKAAARLGWTMAELCQACLSSAMQHAYERAVMRSARG
ncbi:MAG: D-alanine--D-alanine ligase [Planctomycetes bacterium]|nr:D-alanine--D-alanine ligase [Planctomycetota bacterium]